MANSAQHPLLSATEKSPPVVLSNPNWPAAWHQQVTEKLQHHPANPGELVVFSSGTTTQPRGIIRTITSWQASHQSVTDLLQATSTDVIYLPGPWHSTLYAHAAWHTNHLGADIRTPTDDLHDVTIVHCTPQLVGDILAQHRTGHLPQLRTIAVGGDHTPRTHWENCATAGIRLVEYYGAAELSFVAYRTKPGPLTLFADVTASTRAEQLWVRSPYLADRPLDPANRGGWRTDGPWHTVGDHGQITPPNYLHLHGRSATITTGAHTIQLADIEHHARNHPDVHAAVAVAIPTPRISNRLALWVAGPITETALREWFHQLPHYAQPGPIRINAQAPRTAGGKVDRGTIHNYFTTPATKGTPNASA